MLRLTAVLLLALASLPASFVYAADATKGAQIFKKCAVCHAIGPNATTKVGPELNGIVGRPAGSIADYPYSDAMRNAGLTWDEATLRTYIHNPKAVVKGTKMAFPGIKGDSDVDDLIAYLETFDATGGSR